MENQNDVSDVNTIVSRSVLKDWLWRVKDIRETLMAVRGDHSVYGCDEWSTPTINLKLLADLIEKHCG